MPKTKMDDLMSAIYAAALAPRHYDQTIDQLDGLLFNDDNTPKHMMQSTAQTDFERDAEIHIIVARGIQERIGRIAITDQRFSSLINSSPNPAILFTRAGTILAINAPARQRFGADIKTLADYVNDAEALRKIQAFKTSRANEHVIAVASNKESGPETKTCFLVNSIDPALIGNAGAQVYLLSIIDLGFSDHSITLFRSAFSLTRAETDVAVLIASGSRLSEIATKRKVSEDTIRTQIKTIKTKTATKDIPSLVRLLCGFAAGTNANPVLKLAETTDGYITLPDGRRLAYVEQGAPNGRAVLMFHNVPYGVHMPAAAIEHAYKNNLRFIAPFRTGYGDSDLISNCTGDQLVAQVARDHKALLEALGISKALVISHAGGAPFALRFASLYPAATIGLIGISRAPIWRDEWMHNMPKQQRFVFRLTKHTPKLLPVIAWSMIACLESSYAAKFLYNGCKDSEADRKAAENPETVDLIAKDAVAAMHRTLEGFCRECAISQMDFTEEACRCLHKFNLLHGDDDKIVGINQSQTFCDEVPGTTLEIVENAGTLLFYSHWPRVLDAVKRAMR